MAGPILSVLRNAILGRSTHQRDQGIDAALHHPTVRDLIRANRCAGCQLIDVGNWTTRCNECGLRFCVFGCSNNHALTHIAGTLGADLPIIDQVGPSGEHTVTLLERRKCFDYELNRPVEVKTELTCKGRYPIGLMVIVSDNVNLSITESNRTISLPRQHPRAGTEPHCHRCIPRRQVVLRCLPHTLMSLGWDDKVKQRDWYRLFLGKERDQFQWFLEDLTGVPEHERVIESSFVRYFSDRWTSMSGDVTLVRLRKLRRLIRSWLRRLFFGAVGTQALLAGVAAEEVFSFWWVLAPIAVEVTALWCLEARILNTDHEHLSPYQKSLSEWSEDRTRQF